MPSNRFATGLSDDYIPYAYPQTSLGSEFMSAHQQLSSSSKTLFELYQELVNAKKIKTAPFSFQSTDTYTSLYKTGSVTPTQVIGQLFREIQRTNETLRAWNQLLVNDVTEQGILP